MNFLWNAVRRSTMAGILSSWGRIVHLMCQVPGTFKTSITQDQYPRKQKDSFQNLPLTALETTRPPLLKFALGCLVISTAMRSIAIF